MKRRSAEIMTSRVLSRLSWALVALLVSVRPGVGQSEIKVSRSEGGMLTFTSGATTSVRPATSHRSGASANFTITRRNPPTDLGLLIARESSRQGLDRRLVEAVAQVESAFDVAALSHKGAMGLMQLMPQTAKELGVRDPWDAGQNIAGGARYLRQMLDRFGGRLEYALAAYNAGPSAVDRYGGVPPYAETINYVKKVLKVYRGEAPRITPGRASVRRSPIIRVARDANGHLVMTTP